MTMYDFMKETVVMCAFMLIIAADVWWLSYLLVKLVKWVRNKIRKEDPVPEEEPKAETE